MIIDAIADAFTGMSTTKQDILNAAVRKQSHDDVLAVLDRLPQRHFRRIGDLWDDLPDTPIGE